MTRTLRAYMVFVIALVVALGMWTQATQALVLDINEKEGHVEYLGLTGILTGRDAPYRMIVPGNWNGSLLIYAHGTGSPIMLDETGQPMFDDSSGLPIIGVTPLTNVPGVPVAENFHAARALEAALLELGFAMVASNYKPDPRFMEHGLLGWLVEDGLQDTLAVTIEAKQILRLNFDGPQRSLLWGRSQGSLVCLKLIEHLVFSHLYDGAIVGSAVGAGTPRTWDVGLGLALAFDVAFGWDEANWGSVEGGDLPEDLRAYAKITYHFGISASGHL
jgi:hypothetical protein